jgi:hypothetical protein
MIGIGANSIAKNFSVFHPEFLIIDICSPLQTSGKRSHTSDSDLVDWANWGGFLM